MSVEPEPPFFVKLGVEFSRAYYQAFEACRTAVLPMFSPDAMFTFEKHQVQTPSEIAKVLEGLGFQKIQHVITNIDCQPTTDGGSLVLVTGQFRADDDPPHSFSQVFYLKPVDAAGSGYHVAHTIFRIASIHSTM